jgi:hypothetical protein
LRALRFHGTMTDHDTSRWTGPKVEASSSKGRMSLKLMAVVVFAEH